METKVAGRSNGSRRKSRALRRRARNSSPSRQVRYILRNWKRSTNQRLLSLSILFFPPSSSSSSSIEERNKSKFMKIELTLCHYPIVFRLCGRSRGPCSYCTCAQSRVAVRRVCNHTEYQQVKCFERIFKAKTFFRPHPPFLLPKEI